MYDEYYFNAYLLLVHGVWKILFISQYEDWGALKFFFLEHKLHFLSRYF